MKTAARKIDPEEFILSVLSPKERFEAGMRLAREAFRNTALTIDRARYMQNEMRASEFEFHREAKQIGKPLSYIPEDKIEEILSLKRKLGFPDARMEPLQAPDDSGAPANPELEKLVRQVVSRLEER